jgi:hypothetical protein
MAVLPSTLPEGASLPLIVGGALLVAFVISRVNQSPPARLEGDPPTKPKSSGAVTT